MIPSFETIFAVPLSCESCIKDVETSLLKLDGINKVEGDLKAQLISIEGSAPPSAIVAAIQDTGRDAILRGSGKSESAAVCILETHSKEVGDPVRGLIRMVEVAPQMTIIDLTIKGLREGLYHVTVRDGGNIARGAELTGGIWGLLKTRKEEDDKAPKAEENKTLDAIGYWGTVNINKSGVGSAFFTKPIQVLEIYGKSIAVSEKPGDTVAETIDVTFGTTTEKKDIYLPKSQTDPNTLVGVIARSAGVWDNDKTVCSCSGKTVWEEREEQVEKGML